LYVRDLPLFGLQVIGSTALAAGFGSQAIGSKFPCDRGTPEKAGGKIHSKIGELKKVFEQ
jgi:hypothetical protein